MEFERDETHLAHKYYEREDSVMLTIWDHQTMSQFEQTYIPKKKKKSPLSSSYGTFKNKNEQPETIPQH